MSSAPIFSVPKIIGIVNLSRDSFSDGGRYTDPQVAARRVGELFEAGAHWVELGAASSHPDAADVAEVDEIAALADVLDLLGDRVDRLGVDTWKPAVQRYCARRGVAFINDVAAFTDAGPHAELIASGCSLVLMHSVQRGKATRTGKKSASTLAQIERFLNERCEALVAAGIGRERLIVDPGMGFFLGDSPAASLEVLAGLDRLRAAVGLPLLLCVSRKSFLGALTGRDVHERGAATLAAELHCARSGVDYIRTHDVAALVDGLALLGAIEGRR